MAKLDRTRRVARLVSMLGTQKRGSTVDQLVRATGASRATVYRDLELLREGGHALHSETVNGETRHRIIGSELATRPMSPREQAAMALARRALSPLEGSWTVRELDQLLKQAQGTATEDTGILWSLHTLTYSPEILSEVHQAVTQRRALRVRYRGTKDNSAQPRVIHPLELQVVDQQPYLLAWDPQKRGLRTFKLARMSLAKRLMQKCQIPEQAGQERNPRARSVKVWRGDEPLEVRIRIDASVARFVSEWPLVPSQALEPAPKGAVDVCATVLGLEETLRWVLRWGRNAQVIEPRRLREKVIAELRGALAGYRQAIRPPTRSNTPAA